MTSFSSVKRARDEDAIRALERTYDAAWGAGDVDGIISLFIPGAVVINPRGEVVKGLAAIELMLRTFLSGEANATTHSSTIKAVHYVTADVALADGEALIQGAAQPDGSSTPLIVHSFTDVLIKQEGMWRICHIRAYTFLQQ